MRKHNDDHGVSALIGFIIAIVLFSVSFYYVVESSVEREANTTPAEAANFHQLAASVASQIFDKGDGWYANPCLPAALMTAEEVGRLDGSGDPQGRFGLGDEGCEYNPSDPRRNNNLSYAKFANINSAAHDASATNNFVDYEEAHRSLGLADKGLDFHIRSEPVLASVRQILGTGYKDQFLRPLYLGNFEQSASSAASRTSVATTGSFTTDNDFGTVSVLIQNTGTASSGFSVDFSFVLKKKPVTFTVNSFPIAGGCTSPDFAACSQTVSATIRRTDDWDWGTNPAQFTYAVSDAIGPALGQAWPQTVPMTLDMSDPDGPNIDNPITTLSMDRRNYALPFTGSNKWPELKYAAYDGEGSAINSFGGADVAVKVYDPLGVALPTIENPSSSHSLKSALDTNNDGTPDNGLGRYRAELWVPDTASGLVQSTAYFEILGSSGECNIDAGDFTPAASVLTEAEYVDQLFERFQKGTADDSFESLPNLPHIPGPPPPDPATIHARGDVFPDVKCAMNNDLPFYLENAAGEPTLDIYTTLIVGSDVDHNVMTSEAAKGTIRDWVFAGGTLIVFGSSSQSVQWLQPIFHAALNGGSASLYTPDPDHPALNVPNDLDYTTFQALSDWDYNSGSDAYFSHVVSQGDDDVLGISNGGSFGSGKVLLSGWRPYALQTPAQQAQNCGTPLTSACQGLALMHNLVVLSYRNLYLDYGPSIPLNAANGVQTRIASVYHPDLKQLVTVYIQVYVFE